MCSGVGCVGGWTAGQQAVAMRCREHGCVDVCVSVVGVVDGPTARAVRRDTWLLSVMTVTMVVGVCVCSCRVCACVFVEIGPWRGVLFKARVYVGLYPVSLFCLFCRGVAAVRWTIMISNRFIASRRSSRCLCALVSVSGFLGGTYRVRHTPPLLCPSRCVFTNAVFAHDRPSMLLKLCLSVRCPVGLWWR